MTIRGRKWVIATLAVASLVAPLFVAVEPAQAYSDSSVHIYYDSEYADSSCAPNARYEAFTGEFVDHYHSADNTCETIDQYDAWYSSLDPLSRNLDIEIYDGAVTSANLVELIHFEASGEHLDILDFSDDSDTVYFWIWTDSSHYQKFSACNPSCGKGTDHADYNLSLTDNVVMEIEITDDAAGQDILAETSVGLPYLEP